MVIVLALAAVAVISRLVVQDEGAAGKCIELALWESCSAVPLSAFADATGLQLLPDTKVLTSSSSGWGFFHRMTGHGSLLLPEGSSQVNVHRGTARSGTVFSRSINKLALEQQTAFKRSGATSTHVFAFNRLYVAKGWIVEGLFPNGNVMLAIEFQTTNHWSRNAPLISPGSPAPAS